MNIEDFSIRKRIALELFRKIRINETMIHELNYLYWECTLKCNLSCRHCGSDCRKDLHQEDMPLEDFLMTIDKMLPYIDPIKTMVVLTGGEPLLRKDIISCGQELYNRHFPWGVVSNGLTLSERKLIGLLGAGLRVMSIGLDGLESTHNKIRGSKHSFQQALKAINLLVLYEKDLAFDVVTCVNSYNFQELKQLKNCLISIGVKRWRIYTVSPFGKATENETLQLSPIQFKQLMDFIKQTRKEGYIKLNYGCEGFLGNYESEVRDDFFFCRAGISSGAILVDGSISACPNLRSNFIQGNIYEDDFMMVWNNRYAVFRDKSWMKKGECADCKHFRFCQGNSMHLRDEKGDLSICHLKKIKEAVYLS